MSSGVTFTMVRNVRTTARAKVPRFANDPANIVLHTHVPHGSRIPHGFSKLGQRIQLSRWVGHFKSECEIVVKLPIFSACHLDWSSPEPCRDDTPPQHWNYEDELPGN